jgi:GT2 family glycosyltransferase
MRIAILLTVYNRIGTTKECLNKLHLLSTPTLEVNVYVVDGGSTDGTQEMLNIDFPSVLSRVQVGAYWNQGMLHAWQWASNQNYDFYLWMNDDVDLSENWLCQLMELYGSVEPKSIVVGKIVDKTTGSKIYGALYRKKGLSKINFTTSSKSTVKIDTFNGNCVLIPECTFRELGFLNSAYSHSFGDIDYGLRASKSGIRIWETTTPVGSSTKSETIYSGDFLHAPSFQEIFSPKGVPPTEWFKFCKSFGGVLWPVNFIYRYIKLLNKICVGGKNQNGF